MPPTDPEKFDKIKKMVRAIIQPNKQGLPLHKLSYEYRELSGDPLPFRELGFSNVDAFITAMPDTVKVSRTGGDVMLHAIADASTAHIARMVACQKSNKKRTKGHTKFRRPAPRSHLPHRLHSSGSNYGRPPPKNAFSSKSSGYNSGYRPSQPPAKSYQTNPFKSWGQSGSSSSARSSQTAPRRSQSPLTTSSQQSVRSSSSQEKFSSRSQSNSNAPRVSQSSVAFSAMKHAAMASVETPAQSFKKREVSATASGVTITVQQTPPPKSKTRNSSGYELAPRFQKAAEQRSSRSKSPEAPSPPPAVRGSSRSSTATTAPVTPVSQIKKPRIVTSPHFKPCKEIVLYEDLSHLPKKMRGRKAMNNYMQILERYAEKVGQELDFQTIPTGRESTAGYASSVKLKGKVYGSLGIFSTGARAELFVAKNACESLGLLDEHSPSPPRTPGGDVQVTSRMLTDFEKLTKERVRELACSRPNGVWAERLPIEYKQKFGEDAPKDLLVLVQDWPDVIKIESYAQTDRRICYPVQSKPSVTSPKQPSAGHQSQTKPETKPTPAPPPVVKPKVPDTVPNPRRPEVGADVEIFFSSIIDCSEFYVHIKDQNDISDLMGELSIACDQLSSSAKKLSEVKVGMFYAALYDGDWSRIKIVSIDEDEILAQYIDFGNVDVVKKCDMMDLDASLYKYPAQAIKCRLSSVFKRKADSWDRAAEELAALDIVGKTYRIRINAHENDGCSVMLYTRNDCTLNEMLAKKGLVGTTLKTKATDPPALVPPEKEWYVMVTFVYSPTRVIVRLVGEEYSEKLEKLEEVIAELNDIGDSDETIEVGDLCVARIEESTAEGEIPWYRVRILEIQDDMAKVEYLDYGDTEYLSLSEVRLMTPEENTLPYQAFSVALYGLETSEGEEVISVLQDKLVMGDAQALFADIVDRDDDVIWVTLWDTSTAADVNINEDVMLHMDSKEFTPQLPEDQETAECFVSHITQQGHVYLQMKGPGLTMMEKLSQETTSLLNTAGASSCVREPRVGSRVLGLYDETWYRAEIIDVFAENRKVEVFFIDYGNSDIIPFTSLRLLKSVSKKFHRLPPQAMECILDGLPKYGEWTEAALSQLEEVASDDCLMRVEVIEPPTEKKCAVVDLYYLEQVEEEWQMQGVRDALYADDAIWEVAAPSDDVDSVSSSLRPEEQELPDTSDEEDFDKTPDDLEEVFEKVEKLTLTKPPENVRQGPDGAEQNSDEERHPSSTAAASPLSLTGTDRFELPLPGRVEMPTSGDKVMVTLASNPHDFKVIPCSYLDTLQEMMTNMCVYYTSEDTALEVEMVKNVEVGDVCAAYNEDGVWYRVQVSEIISPTLVKVLFLDYGDFNVLSVVDLRMLPEQFRTMPFLVIKSVLIGVQPTTSSWMPEDILRFTELVMEKQLHAIVAPFDEKTDSLPLTLLDDTEKGTAALIHKVLIKEGFAASTQGSRRESENTCSTEDDS